MGSRDEATFRYDALVQLTMLVNAIRSKEEYLEPERADYHRECLKVTGSDSESYSYDHYSPVPPYANSVHLFNASRNLVMDLPVHHNAEQLKERGQITDHLCNQIWKHLRDYVLPKSDEPRLEAMKRLFSRHIDYVESLYGR